MLLLNNLAFLLAEEGRSERLEESLQYAQRAVSIGPNNEEYQDTLGTVYLRNKATESALRIFEKLVERSPESARFHPQV